MIADCDFLKESVLVAVQSYQCHAPCAVPVFPQGAYAPAVRLTWDSTKSAASPPFCKIETAS